MKRVFKLFCLICAFFILTGCKENENDYFQVVFNCDETPIIGSSIQKVKDNSEIVVPVYNDTVYYNGQSYKEIVECNPSIDTITNDTTINVTLKRLCRIKFNETDQDFFLPNGSTIYSDDIIEPVKEGYIFKGWDIGDFAKINVEEHMIVSPIWEAKKETFNTNEAITLTDNNFSLRGLSEYNLYKIAKKDANNLFRLTFEIKKGELMNQFIKFYDANHKKLNFSCEYKTAYLTSYIISLSDDVYLELSIPKEYLNSVYDVKIDNLIIDKILTLDNELTSDNSKKYDCVSTKDYYLIKITDFKKHILNYDIQFATKLEVGANIPLFSFFDDKANYYSAGFIDVDSYTLSVLGYLSHIDMSVDISYIYINTSNIVNFSYTIKENWPLARLFINDELCNYMGAGECTVKQTTNIDIRVYNFYDGPITLYVKDFETGEIIKILNYEKGKNRVDNIYTKKIDEFYYKKLQLVFHFDKFFSNNRDLDIDYFINIEPVLSSSMISSCLNYSEGKIILKPVFFKNIENIELYFDHYGWVNNILYKPDCAIKIDQKDINSFAFIPDIFEYKGTTIYIGLCKVMYHGVTDIYTFYYNNDEINYIKINN